MDANVCDKVNEIVPRIDPWNDPPNGFSNFSTKDDLIRLLDAPKCILDGTSIIRVFNWSHDTDNYQATHVLRALGDAPIIYVRLATRLSSSEWPIKWLCITKRYVGRCIDGENIDDICDRMYGSDPFLRRRELMLIIGDQVDWMGITVINNDHWLEYVSLA